MVLNEITILRGRCDRTAIILTIIVSANIGKNVISKGQAALIIVNCAALLLAICATRVTQNRVVRKCGVCSYNAALVVKECAAKATPAVGPTPTLSRVVIEASINQDDRSQVVEE